MNPGAKVVIAEDDRDLQDLLREVLEAAGYTIEAYSDGEACWERLRNGEVPALGLLDIMLPGMDGIDVLARIRGDVRLAEVPVVFLSGREDEANERGVTADDYVTKPFSPSDLRERIDRLV
jgi:DNA-binding response OmpR family regulator